MTAGLEPLAGSRIVITGAGGMLGRAFVEALSMMPQPASVLPLTHDECDVTHRGDVLGLATFRPDIIVHCAAIALADVCERDPDLARRVQVGGAANIAELAVTSGARVFYPQSVFIFDGRELPVTEETRPTPPFFYGQVKLEAEQLLLDAVPGTLVVRMAGFFGGEERDKNFVGQFLGDVRRLRSEGGGSIEVGDRLWQPTWTLDHATNVLVLLAAGCEGVYHMGGLGEASFYDVARVCVDELGLADEIDVRPCPSTGFAAAEAAPRPLRMVTANRRLEREHLCRQRPWEDALREYLRRPAFDEFRT